MKTYSEDEIAAHIASVLAKMPYDPEPPKKAIDPASFILKHYLRKYGVELNSSNELRSIGSGHLIGKHISVSWFGKTLLWVYQRSDGQTIGQTIIINERE